MLFFLIVYFYAIKLSKKRPGFWNCSAAMNYRRRGFHFNAFLYLVGSHFISIMAFKVKLRLSWLWLYHFRHPVPGRLLLVSELDIVYVFWILPNFLVKHLYFWVGTPSSVAFTMQNYSRGKVCLSVTGNQGGGGGSNYGGGYGGGNQMASGGPGGRRMWRKPNM